MDLTSVLLRIAARRPHALVVPAVGGTVARLAVEASLARRGWPAATGPADADVVVVAGAPGPGLAAVVDRVWRQVPAPRARVVVTGPSDVDGELDRAAAELGDRGRQRAGTAVDDPVVDHGGHGRHDEAADDQHADGGHGGHGGGHHGHHGHGGGMGMPGGLPMAELGEDRDGLTLDRLHVPLGPVLPDWPAGLVVRVTLQGDVVQEAAAEVLDAGHGEPFRWGAEVVAARELDGLARFLGVAGWSDAAACARRLRDALLAGASPDEVLAPAVVLLRRVRRSRTLRWLVRGVPAGHGDVDAVLDQRVVAVRAALGGTGVAADRPGVEELPALLIGAELAAARLIVAAVDPDTDGAAVAGVVRHG